MYSDVVRFSFECRKLNQNLSIIKITHRNKDKYPRRYNEISQETHARKSPDYLRFCILLSMTGWGRRYCKLSRPITKGTKKTKQSTPHQFRSSNGNCCSKASDSVALSFFSFCWRKVYLIDQSLHSTPRFWTCCMSCYCFQGWSFTLYL